MIRPKIALSSGEQFDSKFMTLAPWLMWQSLARCTLKYFGSLGVPFKYVFSCLHLCLLDYMDGGYNKTVMSLSQLQDATLLWRSCLHLFGDSWLLCAWPGHYSVMSYLTYCCCLLSFDFSAGLCNVRPTSISVQFWVVEWLFALTSRSVPYQCDQYCPRSRIQPVAWRCLCGLSLTCPVRLYVHWLRIPYWINIDWLQLRRYFQSWYWTSGGEGLLWRVWPWMQLFLWVWYISQAAVVLLTRPMTKGTLVYQVLYTALSFMGPYSCVIYVLLPWMEACAKQTLSWHWEVSFALYLNQLCLTYSCSYLSFFVWEWPSPDSCWYDSSYLWRSDCIVGSKFGAQVMMP